MHAESKTISQKTSPLLSPGGFRGPVTGRDGSRRVGNGVFLNPGTHTFYPICIFHALTGLNCPGCGMTRALYALLHGKLGLALKDNALFVALLAGLAVWGARFAVRRAQNQPVSVKIQPKFLWLLLVILFVFAVLRNLPGCEWLSP